MKRGLRGALARRGHCPNWHREPDDPGGDGDNRVQPDVVSVNGHKAERRLCGRVTPSTASNPYMIATNWNSRVR